MDKQKLQQLITMAEDRCPAIDSMSHIIKVSAKLKIKWMQKTEIIRKSKNLKYFQDS